MRRTWWLRGVEGYGRVGGVSGGHFERIYRLFGGRAPLGHSQGWLVCHTTTPSRLPCSRSSENRCRFSGMREPSAVRSHRETTKQFPRFPRPYFRPLFHRVGIFRQEEAASGAGLFDISTRESARRRKRGGGEG